MARIQVLNKREILDFEKIIHLNLREQEYVFDLPTKLYDTALSFHDDNSFLKFTLLFGYFKVTHKFYDETLFFENDIKFVIEKYSLKCTEQDILSSKTIYRYKQLIKEWFLVNDYTEEIKSTLQKEANNLANNFVHRKKIFYALANLSRKLNIEIPSYTELTRIIQVALNTKKKDILDKLEPLLKDERLKLLDDFLEKEESSKNRYKIAYFRKIEHSTAKNQMLLSLGKFNTIKSKFHILKEIIDTIGITPKIAQYYAKWVEKGQTSQVTQTNKLNQYFTLLSFVYYQYLIRNDNFIDRFIATVQSAKNSSLRAQKEFSFELEPKKNQVFQSLENAHVSTLNEIEKIVKDKKLSAVKKIEAISVLVEKKASLFKEIVEEKKVFDTVVDNKYNFIEKKSISLQGKLSGILKDIEFDEATSNKNIITAIKYFKETSNITAKAPKEFLNDEERTAVYESGKFRVSLYKALLLFHVSDAIKNGTLNLKYSIKYRNFEDYLIDKEEWKKNKDTLLKVHELESLKDYDKFIEPVKLKLEESFKHTNENIKNGFNTYFTSTDNSFILKTPKVEKDEKLESIAKYFPSNEYISVIDLMHSINEETDFLSSFEHYNQSKSKTNLEDLNP